MPLFEHQRLDVYRASVEFAADAESMIPDVGTGRRHLADQLSRAAASITPNIAEGSGEFSAKDKARFYRMARRSATECAAILELLRAYGTLRPERVRQAEETLSRIVAMLTGLVRRLDRTGPRLDPESMGGDPDHGPSGYSGTETDPDAGPMSGPGAGSGS